MDFLYEMIFLGLTETMKSNNISRWIKLILAALISALFLSVFTVIIIYIISGEENSISDRLLYTIFLIIISSYYLHLVKGINRTK